MWVAVENSYRTFTYPLLRYVASAATAYSLLRRRNNGNVPLFFGLRSVCFVSKPFAWAFAASCKIQSRVSYRLA